MRRWAPLGGTKGLGWFPETLRALAAAGIIDASERDTWLDRAALEMRRDLSPRRLPPGLSKQARRLVEEHSADCDRAELRRDTTELGVLASHDLDPDGLTPDLVTPAPAFLPQERHAAGWEEVLYPPAMVPPVQLLAVEIYGGGVELKWCFSPSMGSERMRELDAVLTDDAGTEYLPTSGGGGDCGPGTPHTVSESFAPGPPPTATTLRVTRGDLTIELRRAREHDDRAPGRVAVRIHLEEQLAASLRWRSSLGANEGFGARLADKARAAHLLGLLEADDLASWQARADRLSGGPISSRHHQKQRSLARAHLERFTADIDDMVSGPRSAHREAAFLAAVLAYEQISLMTPAEGLRWRNKFYAAQYRQREPEARQGRQCAASGTPALIAGPDKRIAGVRISTLALYDDGLVLTWGADPSQAGRGKPLALIRFLDGRHSSSMPDLDLTDDLGTDYSRDASSGQFTGYALSGASSGTSIFSPAVPANARWLRISHDGKHSRVSLADRSSRPCLNLEEKVSAVEQRLRQQGDPDHRGQGGGDHDAHAQVVLPSE